MSIRKANKDETQEILEHALDVFQEATVGKINTNNQLAQHGNTAFLINGGYYLIYSKNRKIMGWIGVGYSYDSYTGEMVGVIPELYVLPLYRKKGIAKILCKEAIQQLNEMGYKKVQLNVFSGNSAKELYNNLGFNDMYTLMEKKIK